MRPPRDLQKTDRTCPKCGTTFGAVADLCKCTKCNHSFYASHIRTAPVDPTVPVEDVRLLVKVIANEDQAVEEYVERSIVDPKAFFKANKRQFRDWETSFDVDPIYVAIQCLLKHDYLSCLDWRESSREIAKTFDKLIAKKNLNIELPSALFGNDQETTDQILQRIGIALADSGLTLCHLKMFSDEYLICVVTDADFEKIRHVSRGDLEVVDASESQ